MANKTGIVVLAAGNSSRLGEPKQLLVYRNHTLLYHTLEAASDIPDTNIIVVTGANADLLTSEINSDTVNLVYNPDWETGMASSIKSGIIALLQLNPETENCIFTVCDQPFISNIIFENLLSENIKSKKGIVASAYANTLGTPVLFNKKYFKILLELQGQQGAKKIINNYLEDVAIIPFEKGEIDIDTKEDYQKLKSDS